MGTLIVYYVFYVVIILLYLLLKSCPASCHVHDLAATLKEKLSWNNLIRITVESYSIFTVSCLINLKFLSF